MASSLADPSEFAVSVAIGYAHVLDKVFGFLERTSACHPIFAALLAVPVLAAYLVVVTLAFAVRAATDGYAHVVEYGRDAALSPAAVLGWFADTVVKLAAVGALLILGVLALALLYSSSAPSLPGTTQL